ncbi:MAG: aldehyde dehydrogenase family protein [Phycisphaeraceae bacterium]|nr:aldehyde dehydrogenase family protein [Phycisphaeraceae bacterium]
MTPAEVIDRAGLRNHPRVVLNATAPDSGLAISHNPATGQPIAGIRLDDAASYEKTVTQAVETFKTWRLVPAPIRGQIVRAIGDELRRHKDALGALVSLEVGKILAEGLGEVQETIDIADYAVGLSRNLGGPVLSSERPNHAMYEQWHPLGPIGVITAFNFPNAVWGWNAMLAAVCGDVTIWKPSLFAPLTAIATNEICEKVAAAHGHPGIFRLVIGQDAEIGERMVADRRIPLISATGSTRMGKRVGQIVAGRVGRTLLELGGNNGLIVTPSADLDLALKSVVFGAVGTAGQRCTTTRRLIIHESIADGFVNKLVAAYKTVRIGDPLAEGTLMGPLINAKAVENFLAAIAAARQQGGAVLVGGDRYAAPGPLSGGHYVQPTIIRAPTNNSLPIAMEETFAPILYVFTYRDLDQAIAIHNSVDAGLASAIFTNDVRESQRFISPTGSDCGLAYVNLGTSGAEIGGAFGGEKDTGGGRESGSDSWKAYMRRQTCTINFGTEFKLAQGIRFE